MVTAKLPSETGLIGAWGIARCRSITPLLNATSSGTVRSCSTDTAISQHVSMALGVHYRAAGGPAQPIRRVASCRASTATEQRTIFVVQNVFKVKTEHFADFEEVWRTRESHLKEMPGFVRFAMLKCANIPGKYISQTTWENKAAFENWTQSAQFRASHGDKDSKRPSVGTMLEGPPSPEMYESVTVTE